VACIRSFAAIVCLRYIYVNLLIQNFVLVQKGSVMSSVHSVANKTAILIVNLDKVKISVQSVSVINSISFVFILHLFQ
jgi:hypothetical protein